MKLDLKRIDADLKEAAGNIPYKVRKGNGMRLSIRETDKGMDILINPMKVRSPPLTRPSNSRLH